MSEGVEVVVRRADDRFSTTVPGRTTRHSFSFGAHYDPADVGFHDLVCLNDDRVEPGGGYPEHPHRDLEIVTIVLSGALTHRDLSGPGEATVLEAGSAQAMSAGSGIVHSELVEPGAGPTRFLQSWVRPRTTGLPPAHATTAVGRSSEGGWLPLASGAPRSGAALPITADATLLVAELAPGVDTPLPETAALHLFVVGGQARLSTEAPSPIRLGDGDAVRMTGPGSMSGSISGSISGSAGTQVLVWAFERGPLTARR